MAVVPVVAYHIFGQIRTIGVLLFRVVDDTDVYWAVVAACGHHFQFEAVVLLVQIDSTVDDELALRVLSGAADVVVVDGEVGGRWVC